jgi:hypothetical protein
MVRSPASIASYRLHTRAAVTTRDGMHWFWCRQCRTYAALRPSEAVALETPPMHPSGMRMSDGQLAVRIDAAIVKDRIAAYYRSHWDGVSVRELSERLSVSERHVKAVALDLGVYE